MWSDIEPAPKIMTPTTVREERQVWDEQVGQARKPETELLDCIRGQGSDKLLDSILCLYRPLFVDVKLVKGKQLSAAFIFLVTKAVISPVVNGVDDFGYVLRLEESGMTLAPVEAVDSLKRVVVESWDC
ncbi:hypothetical protein BGW39_006488 [Mortierella sp. 14UC]|nr:hypothetical protein BGW39_006488 [Mortierella sp. 14UC]